MKNFLCERTHCVFGFLFALLALVTCDPQKREGGKGLTTPVRKEKSRTTLHVLSTRRLREDDKLMFSVRMRNHAEWQQAIDSVSVQLGEVLQAVLMAADTLVFTLSPKETPLPMGKQNIQVWVHLKDDKREQHTISCTLLAKNPPKKYRYTVEKIHPHDPDSYTQGLFCHEGYLYESTGQKGASFLQKVDIRSARILQKASLSEEVFGEGITRYGQKIYQLTWEAKKGYIYQLDDFNLLDSFRYETEGWGITRWKNQLAMSDGTEYLRFYTPDTMEKVREVQVYDHKGKVEAINELETVGNVIYANIYPSKQAKVIIPETGQVLATIDFKDLYDFSYYERRLDVMNGIAYNADTNRFYVTGKWWPKLFELTIEETP